MKEKKHRRITDAKEGDLLASSLKGYLVDVPYDELEWCFGPPNVDLEGGDDKIDARWELRIDDIPVSIYNYKDGPRYLGTAGTPVTDMTHWHIGGHTPVVMELMGEIFPDRIHIGNHPPLTSNKLRKWDVHFMMPYQSWEGVEAYSKEQAIRKCQPFPEPDYADGPFEYIVNEVEEGS